MERERSRFLCDSILHVVAVIVSILPLFHWSLRRHCSCFLFGRCYRRHVRLGGALPFREAEDIRIRFMLVFTIPWCSQYKRCLMARVQ